MTIEFSLSDNIDYLDLYPFVVAADPNHTRSAIKPIYKAAIELVNMTSSELYRLFDEQIRHTSDKPKRKTAKIKGPSDRTKLMRIAQFIKNNTEVMNAPKVLEKYGWLHYNNLKHETGITEGIDLIIDKIQRRTRMGPLWPDEVKVVKEAKMYAEKIPDYRYSIFSAIRPEDNEKGKLPLICVEETMLVKALCILSGIDPNKVFTIGGPRHDLTFINIGGGYLGLGRGRIFNAKEIEHQMSGKKLHDYFYTCAIETIMTAQGDIYDASKRISTIPRKQLMQIVDDMYNCFGPAIYETFDPTVIRTAVTYYPRNSPGISFKEFTSPKQIHNRIKYLADQYDPDSIFNYARYTSRIIEDVPHPEVFGLVFINAIKKFAKANYSLNDILKLVDNIPGRESLLHEGNRIAYPQDILNLEKGYQSASPQEKALLIGAFAHHGSVNTEKINYQLNNEYATVDLPGHSIFIPQEGSIQRIIH